MSEAKKSHGWMKAGVVGMLGLSGGAAGTYATAVIDKVVKPSLPVANFAAAADPDGMSVTCQKFIWDRKVRSGKVTILSPEPVTVDEAYAAFYAALETMGLTETAAPCFSNPLDPALGTKVLHLQHAVTYVFQQGEKGKQVIKRIKQIGYATTSRLILEERDFTIQYFCAHRSVITTRSLESTLEEEREMIAAHPKLDP